MTATFTLTPHDFDTAPTASFGDRVQLQFPASGTLQNLSPNYSYRWNVTVRNQTTGSVSFTFQGKTTAVAAGQDLVLSLEVDPEQLPAWQVDGSGNGWIFSTIDLINPPSGIQRAELLALVPNPRLTNQFLDSLRLNAYRFPTTADPSAFVTLDQSRLDYKRLVKADDYLTWLPITGSAISLTMTRGVASDGITARGEAGTLQADFYRELSIRALALTRGTRVQLIDVATRRRLFTGTLDRPPNETHSPNGDYRVSLTASDRVAEMAAIKRWQITQLPSWHWTAIISELLDKHQIPWNRKQVGSVADPLLGPVMREASVVEYLDMAMASVSGHWWVDAYGTVQVAEILEGLPAARISDSADASLLPLLRHIAGDTVIDTASILSGVAATWHTTSNETGELQAASQQFEELNTTLLAAYGHNVASVDLMNRTLTAARQAATRALREYEPRLALDQATFTPLSRLAGLRDDAALDILTGLDVMEPIAVTTRGENLTERIHRITHRLTSNRWQVDLSLSDWQE